MNHQSTCTQVCTGLTVEGIKQAIKSMAKDLNENDYYSFQFSSHG